MFKVGDLVREIETGEQGVIKETHTSYTKAWWIEWKTGHSVGEVLWLYEDDIDMICAAPTVSRYVDLDGETITILGLRYKLTKI